MQENLGHLGALSSGTCLGGAEIRVIICDRRFLDVLLQTKEWEIS